MIDFSITQLLSAVKLDDINISYYKNIDGFSSNISFNTTLSVELILIGIIKELNGFNSDEEFELWMRLQ